MAGTAAHLLIMEDCQHRDAAALRRLQKALEAGEDALKVIQSGPRHKLFVNPAQHSFRPRIEIQIGGEQVLLPQRLLSLQSGAGRPRFPPQSQ